MHKPLPMPRAAVERRLSTPAATPSASSMSLNRPAQGGTAAEGKKFQFGSSRSATQKRRRRGWRSRKNDAGLHSGTTGVVAGESASAASPGITLKLRVLCPRKPPRRASFANPARISLGWAGHAASRSAAQLAPGPSAMPAVPSGSSLTSWQAAVALSVVGRQLGATPGQG